jgi:RHS repeat-associated protein
LLSESFTGGPLDGLAVTNDFDAFLRRTALAVDTQPTTLTRYGYDAAGRLVGVTNGNYSAAYEYLASASLVGTVSFRENATLRMTTTRQYDFLNRLTSISSSNAQLASPISHAYTYDQANQRVRVGLADGSYWLYEYDALGQVRSGKRFWSDWTPVAGQQFEYAHDDIGNRKSTQAGGDENGANLRSANYSANYLNQYWSRTVPRAADVMGIALATASVSVTSPNALNNAAASYRKGEYFRKQLSYSSAGGHSALWEEVTVSATGQNPNTSGHLFVPATPEGFTHDADGNLTSDGRWNYTWDAENRLVRIVKRFPATDQASIPYPSAQNPTVFEKVRYEYDWKGRRIAKSYYSTAAGSTPFVTYRFVYDGWNLIAILDSQSSILQSFLWGLDLSGTMQGAGGVGGLLAVSDAAEGTHFACYDGNGNVTALVKAIDGSVSARYEYGPFGEALRATGPMAKANPFRFSTKFQDDETDLLYYGYRYYNPSTGRWANRDPLEENGGRNLYTFVFNQPLTYIDTDGRAPSSGGSDDSQKPPEIDCSGYASLGGQTCRTCFGLGTRKDGYPEKAHKVCEGFRDLYTGAPNQGAAACVAQCLISEEKGCQRLKWCSHRNCCRLAAHVACYVKCGFIPHRWFPDGAFGVGFGELAPSCESKGLF